MNAVCECDFTVRRESSLVLFQPCNEAACKRLQELRHDESLFWCGAMVVELRYAEDLAAGLCEEGFTVGDE